MTEAEAIMIIETVSRERIETLRTDAGLKPLDDGARIASGCDI